MDVIWGKKFGDVLKSKRAFWGAFCEPPAKVILATFPTQIHCAKDGLHGDWPLGLRVSWVDVLLLFKINHFSLDWRAK